MRISGIIMMILWLHLSGACSPLLAMNNETDGPDFPSVDAPASYEKDKSNPKDKTESFLQISRDSALITIDKLIQAAASAGDTVMLSEAYYLKGVALYMDAAFDSATVFFSKSAGMIGCKQCPDRRASIYTKTSENLFLTDQSEEATEYLGKAWNICEENGDLEGCAGILVTLARQFERLGLSSQYLNYLKLLRMNYLPKIKSPQLRIQICLLNASQMARTGQLRNAWAYYSKAEKLLSEDPGVYYTLSLAKTRSELHFHAGNREQAVKEL